MDHVSRPSQWLFSPVCLIAAVLSGAVIARASERSVVIDAETAAVEVNRYYSMHAHGPTMKFYKLSDVQIVVVVTAVGTKPDVSAMVYVFPESATAEGIDKWINNRHSDGLYPETAEPDRTIPVAAELFRATVTKPLGHEVGPNGDEYDRVRVDFTIDAFTDGDVTVKESRGSLEAFIRTKDLPGRR